MNKLFTPNEQSLDMKSIGFDEPCLIKDTEQGEECAIYYVHDNGKPTYSQAFSWFREKYKLHGGIHQSGDMDDRYTFRINFTCYPHNSVGRGDEYSYPEAELECLKKLIEIVKQK